MPIILRHVWEFVVAVLRQWGALVTGGFVVALIGVYEHASGRPIAGGLFWIAVIMSLLVAFFVVWRKERLTVERLSRGREVRDYLSRSLTAIDKFIRVLNDPHQIVPIDRINEWEVETRIFLRQNVSEAAENLFMSETGAPPPPPCKFIEERAEPLRRLHYRSHQLHKILERLGLD
jgi:hypothetical protein